MTQICQDSGSEGKYIVQFQSDRAIAGRPLLGDVRQASP